jgi:hypothetical protein
MRCWIIHRWNKWEPYTVEYKRDVCVVSAVPELGTWGTSTVTRPETFTEERQRRVCQRCGWTQDRRVSER